MSAPDRRAMVERPSRDLSVRRQCALLSVARSGVYRSKPVAGADDLAVMRRIDEALWCNRRLSAPALKQPGAGSGRTIDHATRIVRRFIRENAAQSLRRGSVSLLHFAGFRSGPGERQGDIAWDAVQIFNNLSTKPEPSWSKLALPTRVDLGRFAPQGRRPINFGNIDFATAIAAEIAGKSDEFEAAFALGRRRLGAIEQLGPHLLVEMFQPLHFDLSLALERRQLFGRNSVRPDGLLCDSHEFAE